MKTTICLIRHGQTDWNKNQLIQGRKDIPLNETGISQAQDAGMLLAEIDPNWDIIISSPLSRAYETGKIIASYINYKGEIIKDPDVIEREFGAAEGCDIEPKIYARMDRDDIEGIEKTKDLQKRSFDTMIKLSKLYPGKKILVTTHSHFIKGLVTTIMPGFTFYSRIANSALNYFIIEDDSIIDYKINITKDSIK